MKCPICDSKGSFDCDECNYKERCKPKSHWISVKDKVPEKYQEVIVYLGGDEVDIRYRLGEEYPDDPDIYNRYVWSDQGVANDITHWMPLPLPPERDQKSIDDKGLCDGMENF